jgi:hypothetical protein
MLWITREVDGTSSPETFNEDFAKRHYFVLKRIAETVFSPVALLDSVQALVLVYDVDTMDIDSDGTCRLKPLSLTLFSICVTDM